MQIKELEQEIHKIINSMKEKKYTRLQVLAELLLLREKIRRHLELAEKKEK